jgi:UDP-N-acetylmuramoyl-L-alanyl-D-glutamate--2,6-diaminopimelate ligase
MSLPVHGQSLATLLEGIATAPADVTVNDIAQDSREVVRGGLFLAMPGRRSHGVERAAEAAAAGARAILWEPAPGIVPPRLQAQVFSAAVENLTQRAGLIADRFFGAPSRQLAVAGITGTNGKTTCAWLLAQALEHCGRRCGYMGTLGAGFPGALQAGSFTTPDSVTVHRQLAALLAAGATSVAMEVSSHALDQQRLAGVRVRVAAFTNLTRDHLDYHGTMAAYGAAKARLLDWPDLDARVINYDDPFGRELVARSSSAARLYLTTRAPATAVPAPRAAATWLRAEGAEADGAGLRWRTHIDGAAHDVAVRLIGAFNVENALTVLGMLLALDVAPGTAVAALARCSAPPGRMEAIGGGVQPLAIVDYAHTPDALAQALQAARAHCRGRLSVVFGCGGDRDRGKRPLMGRIAQELADAVVLTDDNPRSEPAEHIVAEIREGMTADRSVRVLHDRAAAIRTALHEASSGDVVLVAGKGHEDYQIVGNERRVFSDQRVVRAALAARADGQSQPALPGRPS